MRELTGKQEFFTWEEFGLCRAAAGFDRICCYEPPPQGEPSLESLLETVFALIRQGRLAKTPDGFIAAGETAACFQQMGQAQSMLFLYRREYQTPVCLLYGGAERFVSVQPGRREGEYVGICSYAFDELPEWIADMGIVLPGNLPDDLLCTVQEEPEPQGADVRAFLTRNVHPADRRTEQPPEEIPWFAEQRRASNGHLLATLFLVRQSLFDLIVTGARDGITQQLYQTGALAEIFQSMLKDKED